MALHRQEEGMEAMIPVHLAPEPNDFDKVVRKRGHKWLRKNNIPLNAAPTNASKLPRYWSKTNEQLWKAYNGVCAYFAIYFEWVSGASSTDHFVAKSRNAGEAYEWKNYRLACLGANRQKLNYDDILDPVGLPDEVFYLNFLDGRIFPNPSLGDPLLKKAADDTIERLELDSPEHRAMRVKHFNRYLQARDGAILKELSPFVWKEADRQGLL